MKATRKTIPSLIEKREFFENESGTMYSLLYPRPVTIDRMIEKSVNETEKSRLRIDAGIEGRNISYIVVSYETPIAWETRAGDFYIIKTSVSQTTDQHVGLVRLSEVVD